MSTRLGTFPTLRRAISGLGCLVVLLAAPEFTVAQTLRGSVVAAENRAPLSGTVVQLVGSDGLPVATTTADDNGRFELAVPSGGDYRLRAERLGYVVAVVGPIRLEADQVTEVTVRLGVDAVPLDALIVEVDAAVPSLARVGYYDRKRLGQGHYIERPAIDERKPSRTSDLLRGLSGVRLMARRNSMDVLFRAGGLVSIARSRERQLTSCMPPVFLDGLLVSHPKLEPSELDDRFDIDSLPWGDIEAIEVYTSPAQVPAQYSGAYAACGVLLFWTRK